MRLINEWWRRWRSRGGRTVDAPASGTSGSGRHGGEWDDVSGLTYADSSDVKVGTDKKQTGDQLRADITDSRIARMSTDELTSAVTAAHHTTEQLMAVDRGLLPLPEEELDAWIERIGPERASIVHATFAQNLSRTIGEVVPDTQRNMTGTKMYLAYSDLTPDQQQWFDRLEEDWMLQLAGTVPDLHVVFDQGSNAWQIRAGDPQGQPLPIQPTFKIGPWGPTTVNIRRRLAHLFLDRNRIEATVHVYRKSGALFEQDIVTHTPRATV